MYQRQAQGLASLGRGPDTELVHMTPREVGALNTLARQNGLDGLPTNPQTGLPEAGIFDSLAPILIGAGAAAAAPFTGGGSLAAFLSSPFLMGSTAALGAGIASGFDAAEMAKWGLGIYGGANLAGSLSAAGSAPAAGGAAGTGGTAVAPTTGGTTLAGATQPLTTDAIQKQAIAEAGKKLSAEEAAKIAAKDLTQKQLGTAARDLTLQGGDKFFQFTPEVGKQQFAAMGRGILNPKIAASTVGKAPFVAGIGSVAADQYSQMKDVEPFEFPKDEFKPFYPEGGFMPPPRTSIDPFAGDPVAADFSEERMFFDPAPYTSPGYMPAKAGGLVSLHEGGNVQAEMARNRHRQDQLQQTSNARRWTGGTLEEFIDWYESGFPSGVPRTMAMPNYAKLYEDAGGAEGTPATATSGSAFDSQMAQVERDKKAGIFGGNQGLLPITPSSGMLPITPSSGSGPISSEKSSLVNSGIKSLLEQLLNQLGFIQMQSKNQGGLLRGPGDGMSDDIMLPITGSRDIAAVSPGEFVVSADVVAGLGNGSTSAGAKQLYGMMDRVRDARTGKTTQPRAIDAGKMMPA